MKFSDIPTFIRPAYYRVDVEWTYLEETLLRYDDRKIPGFVFDMNPDFQRGHVWNEEQQRRYVEFILRDGQSSRDIHWNCVGWQANYKGPMVLVDGKQRLEAVLKFLRNELAIFNGHLRKDFQGRLPCHATFRFNINNLDKRSDWLQWYLDLNEGGVVHTKEELNRVRELLTQETK